MEQYQQETIIQSDAENQVESREKRDFSEMISKYLNDDSFLEKVRSIKYESNRDDFIGMVVEYFILHRDSDGIDEYVEGLLKSKETKLDKGDLLIQSVKHRFGIETPDEDLSDDETDKIYEYIYQNMLKDGYVFHGFNGVFENSIKENGLDQSGVLWSVEELDDIGKIGEAYHQNLVGMHYTHIGDERLTSSGKNYYDNTSQFFYSYASNSPEWFGMFCNNGENRGTYHKRNYEGAHANVEECVGRMRGYSQKNDARPFTHEDESKIIGFFEKYWQKFAGEESGLKLALIDRRAITENEFGENEYERNLDTLSLSQQRDRSASKYDILDPRPRNIKMISQLIYSIGHNGNSYVKYTIAPEYMTIINLPDPKKVYDLED